MRRAAVGQNAASAREMAAAGKAKRLTLSADALYEGRVVKSAAAELPHWVGEFSPAQI
jgi:hypothetical protein